MKRIAGLIARILTLALLVTPLNTMPAAAQERAPAKPVPAMDRTVLPIACELTLEKI